jgi:flagellar hook protein FlgE
MLGAIFTSLSGMNAYRNGLDTISNNVANMNTPGFKLSDPLFRDLVHRYGGAVGNASTATQPSGAGVSADGSAMSFKQGDLRDTGNSLDAAIDGAGFFVLEQDGQRSYTRAGQFEFDKDGLLVERGTGARVLVSTETLAVGYFNITGERAFPPRTTTEVTLTGTLARGGTGTTFEVPNVTVIDSTGTRVTLRVRFARDAADPLHWTLEVVDANNAVLGSGDIRFNANGTPADGTASVTVSIPSAGSTAFDVAFSVGAADTFGGVTSPVGSTTTQVQFLRQNGVELGSLTKTEYTDRGEIKLTYSNGETRNVATLLLAQFDDPDQLQVLGDSRFAARGTQEVRLSSPLEGGTGRIAGSKIELSNVDLTSQFTDLIIVQRGYQASSQISSVANEMIQQLLAISGGR